MSDGREMYQEIAELVGTIAKAFLMEDADAIRCLEAGEISLSFDEDDNGNPFVLATYQGRRARLYKGAISYETAATGLEN